MLRRSLLVLLALCAAPAFATPPASLSRMAATDAQGKVLQETTITRPVAQVAPDGSAGEAYRLSVVQGGQIVQTATLLVPNFGDATFDLTRNYPYRKSVSTPLDPHDEAHVEMATARAGLAVQLSRANDVVRLDLDQSNLEAIQTFTSGEAAIDLPQRSGIQVSQSLKLRAGESISIPLSGNLAKAGGFFPSHPAVTPERTLTLTRLGNAGPLGNPGIDSGVYRITLEKEHAQGTERINEIQMATLLGTAQPLRLVRVQTYLESSRTTTQGDGTSVTTLKPETVETGLVMNMKVTALRNHTAQLTYDFSGTELTALPTVIQADGNPVQKPQVAPLFRGAGATELAVGQSQRVPMGNRVTATITRLN